MAELDRREFLKLLSVTAGAAAAAGCSEPVEKLIPYVVQPEEITPGIPVIYASTCRECPAACGLHVKTREARPVKLEGNPAHPVNRGALCARGQAAIGRTYHPDRFPGPQRRSESGALEAISWDDGVKLLAQKVREAGAGTWVLGGDVGPTANRWIDRWVQAVGAGGRVLYEPFAPEALHEAARQVFGVESAPVFDLSGSDLVLDFGSDFLDAGPSPTEHARQLAEARDVSKPERQRARFVCIAPRLSMTASNADEWIAAKPGTEGMLALAIAKLALRQGASAGQGGEALDTLLAGVDVARVAEQSGVEAATLERLAGALVRARAPVALPPGVALRSRRATATAGAVMVLNHVAGAVGRSVRFPATAEGTPRRRSSYRELLALIDTMKSGKVRVLLIHDANPVHTLPASTGFNEALEKVPFVVSFASSADETAARAHLVLPDHTPLESWGDAAPRPGVRSLVQPTVRPLHDTRALVDTLLDVGRAAGAQDLPSRSFRTLLEEAWAGTDFRAALARGGEFGEVPDAPVALAPTIAKLEVVEPLLEGDGQWSLLAFPSPLLYDGRGANLPWLQEIPDPVTKIAWQSWAEISEATARRLGVELGDVVAVKTTAGTLEVPVLPRGGIRDDVVAIPIGQGHHVGTYASKAVDGRPGEARGVNVIEILPAAADESGGRAWLAARASLSPTGRHRRLAFVQQSQDKRQRRLAEAVSLVALAGSGEAHGDDHGGGHDAHGNGHGEGHGGAEHHELLKPYDPTKDAHPDSEYRWGMAIDLDRCTGCSACVAACYVENNVPVVGELNTLMARQMSWIRIERFVGEGSLEGGKDLPILPHESPGEPDVRNSPMLCQQCGAAPCESVCPVLATYHNPEGLNGMIYNRCVGTRYCSNNCPYKVRRFNYYDYSRENWPGLLGMMLNPDVTVRGQGVMEKCTFCVQRIASARQVAKDEGRPIRDGEVTTACAQACPTQAITFGNLKDEGSRVAHVWKDEARSYHALHELNTRPAVNYLAKVQRGRIEDQG